MISALRCTNYRGKVTCLVAIESIARKTHHLAGEGYIAKFGCQMKQTNLVFDNISVNYSWDYSFTLSRLVDKDSHLYQIG